MSFFSIQVSTLFKMLFMIFTLMFRLFLYFRCLGHEPLTLLETAPATALQVINTVFLFINMTIVCMVFSSNIQRSEHKLFIYNQKLKTQANTDPLTTLHNRRYMLDLIETRILTNPRGFFTVALGDIDFFKNVNDTLGHECGDMVLQELAMIFKDIVKDQGHICRWGGEEFFFFFPDMNLDDACKLITELHVRIEQHQFQYKEKQFNVTMTFGLEEYDYHSTLNDLIKKADDKLYYGKNHGRNRVVF
jgi:diguanylate cyclase (GGDEF)-like protein